MKTDSGLSAHIIASISLAAVSCAGSHFEYNPNNIRRTHRHTAAPDGVWLHVVSIHDRDQ